ncbi:murein hydrolase activator EnvC [Cognatishimia sp. MH4019]|uniref:murein hydrolase activator EnvC family protein n=1 Tax=Cognatishimia sp. MH4019 TaxID=2854030 RepID=UPI001CD3ECA3|nr:peptidase M23 [Cognatishimia sp. MH4019]
MIRPLVICLALLAAPAQANPADAARAAADQLNAASLALQDAEGRRDRVAALTQTVQAYEAGLSAMRDGLRRASIREQALERELTSKSREIAQLLSVLQTIESAPAPLLMMHPSGPLGSARSGMIVSDVTPALQVEAAVLKAQLDEMQTLRVLQESATETLRNGLNEVQTARTALSQAISQRTDLPQRFIEDPVKTAILLDSSETLEAFASGLSEIPVDGSETEAPFNPIAKGDLPLPVIGQVLRQFNEADAAGIRRPGILVATRPRALVTTPFAASIRYRGPLLDYGNVIILEPEAGALVVMAGLGQVYGAIGDVLPEGSAVGLMGGPVNTNLTASSLAGSAPRSETLYIETREANTPVDPSSWFALTKE